MANDKDAWIKDFLGIDVEAPATSAAATPAATTSAAPASDKTQPAMADAAPGPVPAQNERFGLLPVIPPILIPPIIDIGKRLFDTHVCHVTITNNTDLTLSLDPSSEHPESGKSKSHPAKTLEPNGKGTTTFEVDSDGFLSNVEGTVRYVSTAPKQVFACHYKNPRLLSNDADASADPSGTYSATADAGSGDDAKFTFTFEGTGGSPTPTPNGGDTGVAASCRVAVVNQTQQTIYLRKQDKAAGDYVTNPATSLAPGARTDFVFAQTPNGKDPGCRGLMTWEVGDPSQAKWDLMFDNVKGGKNLSASFLDPKDGGLHTLDQIDDGDENVPVTFTLSGAGGTTPPATATKTSCLVTVTNDTKLALTLLAEAVDSGSFTTAPPKSIAPGQQAMFAFSGPADDPGHVGAAGRVTWQLGDDTASTCVMQWANPPGDANTAQATVTSGDPSFQATATAGKGDTDVLVAFDVTGGTGPSPGPGPNPGPEPTPGKDDDFDAPPQSKQPTLRKGDDSPDGWIEYAQKLLGHAGYKLPINGKFDSAMHKAVVDFQTAHDCQPDGTIGNETWSVLREAKVKDAIGVDGNPPHSFEEKGAQARFWTESQYAVAYAPTTDEFTLTLVSTGEQKIDDFSITMKVTQPDGTSHTHKQKIGSVSKPSPDGQGASYKVVYQAFTKKFALGTTDPASCQVAAYLDQEIGGDEWNGPVVLAG